MKIIIVGGGAAGFFFASQSALKSPNSSIKILQQGKEILVKVRISGGGRCNLTHHCFDPKKLIQNYPRGGKEMLGPFHRFGPKDTVDWFEARDVQTKVEQDGRMFPTSDKSQSIIDCLTRASKSNNVEIHLHHRVENISPIKDGMDGFDLELSTGKSLHADILFLATGSSKPIWSLLDQLGLKIIAPVPSLFTFVIKDPLLDGLAGISLENVRIEIPKWNKQSSGPLLITHKGLSGPAVLKLSSIAAPEFHSIKYKTSIEVDFCPSVNSEQIRNLRQQYARKSVASIGFLGMPKRLCQAIINSIGIDLAKRFADLSNLELDSLEEKVKKSVLKVEGQNKFKDEFVTAGGVDLKEMNFSSFECKKIKNLYIAGEALNIDAVTGGFNFQAAWTGAYIAAEHIAEKARENHKAMS